MRVEQRIGRIDRVGQQYPKIRIVNLQYDDTIETAVYRVLQERIGFFTSVVGKLQPILSGVSHRIAAAVLSADAPVSGERVVAGIEEEIAARDAAPFDLDSLVGGELETDQRPQALYGLGDLRDVLSHHDVFIPEATLDETHSSEFQYVTPGTKKLRITISPEYYDAHTEDVELWSPGNPLFPDPADVVNREAATQVNLPSLLQ